MIPLALRIHKESHRSMAAAQDMIVDEVYRVFPRAVLHGGTAIWRCYGAKRFSEDLDFYLPNNPAQINNLFLILELRGFKIIKKKISERSVYSELELNRIRVRLEAIYLQPTGIPLNYETSDGSIITILSLTPEEFLKEKVAAYLKRRKIRDLYDIFFLLQKVTHLKEIKKTLSLLLDKYEPPLDEPELKAIILEGAVLNSNDLLAAIKRTWERIST